MIGMRHVQAGPQGFDAYLIRLPPTGFHGSKGRVASETGFPSSAAAANFQPCDGVPHLTHPVRRQV